MIVTQIESINKTRCKVYIDGQLAFVLYKGELSRYKLRENKEIDEETYDEIVNQVLAKRAKLYCMNLLKTMDKTEHQLRQKLREKSYPQEISDRAIDYVKSFKYVDDSRYASHYIDYKGKSKSRQQIVMELQRKGVPHEVINQVYEEKQPADEEALIRRLAEKKKFNPSTATPQEKQKLYMFLMRKGFASRDIGRVLKETSVPDTFA